MKICDICGDEYQEHSNNQRYCKACGKHPDQARRRYERAEIINKIHAGDLHKPIEITCKECGKKILTTYTRTFCSTACAEEHRIKTATCLVCGKSLSESGNFTGRGFCSNECREGRQKQTAILSGNYIPCEYCGKKFIRKNYANRFCTQDCYKSWKAEHLKQYAPTRKEEWTEERKCEWCDKPFAITRERMGQKFCSIGCRKEKAEYEKLKSHESLKLGEELHICTVCKTSQFDCRRFQSNFVYAPKGVIWKPRNDNLSVLVSCPELKG